MEAAVRFRIRSGGDPAAWVVDFDACGQFGVSFDASKAASFHYFGQAYAAAGFLEECNPLSSFDVVKVVPILCCESVAPAASCAVVTDGG